MKCLQERSSHAWWKSLLPNFLNRKPAMKPPIFESSRLLGGADSSRASACGKGRRAEGEPAVRCVWPDSPFR